MSSAMSLTAIGLVIAATIGIGLFGLRISRTTSDFYVASRAVTPAGTRPRSAANTCRRHLSSESPGWCW